MISFIRIIIIYDYITLGLKPDSASKDVIGDPDYAAAKFDLHQHAAYLLWHKPEAESMTLAQVALVSIDDRPVRLIVPHSEASSDPTSPAAPAITGWGLCPVHSHASSKLSSNVPLASDSIKLSCKLEV